MDTKLAEAMRRHIDGLREQAKVGVGTIVDVELLGYKTPGFDFEAMTRKLTRAVPNGVRTAEITNEGLEFDCPMIGIGAGWTGGIGGRFNS